MHTFKTLILNGFDSGFFIFQPMAEYRCTRRNVTDGLAFVSCGEWCFAAGGM